MRTQEGQGAERIWNVPGGFGAALLRKRLGENEQTVHGVREDERGGGPERKAEIDVAEESAHGRADDESHAEGSGEIAELLGAFFGGSDVGYVSEGTGNVGGGDAGDDAADEQPFERGREGHEDVVDV